MDKLSNLPVWFWFLAALILLIIVFIIWDSVRFRRRQKTRAGKH